MIKSADIIAHLKAIPSTPYRFVGGASDFQTALDQLLVSPSAFVLPSSKLAGQDANMPGIIRQHITPQFSVVIAVSGVGAAGGEQLDSLEDLEEALIDQLVGWQPGDLTDPFVYAGGRMIGVDIDKNVMFWGSDFAAGFYLRK